MKYSIIYRHTTNEDIAEPYAFPCPRHRQ